MTFIVILRQFPLYYRIILWLNILIELLGDHVIEYLNYIPVFGSSRVYTNVFYVMDILNTIIQFLIHLLTTEYHLLYLIHKLPSNLRWMGDLCNTVWYGTWD